MKKHKFDHGFLDTINSTCSCNAEEESVSHYLLRCSNFTQIRISLMNEISIIIPDLNLLDDSILSKILLYGDRKFTFEVNSKIIKITIQYILASKRFDIELFS